VPNAPFVLLLPPSEGKAPGGSARPAWRGESGLFAESLGEWRTYLADELRRIGGGGEQLLGVGGDHLSRARAANSSLIGAPTLPAWRRYSGVVWAHLDPESLTETSRARIWVVSGLAGLVAATDPLPDYRLKMSARLPSTGPLAAWWRDDLTDALLETLPRIGAPLVVDLLPQEHRAAVDWTRVAAVRLDLVTRSGGKAGGHAAKAAKGLLARALLDAGRTDPARIAQSFRHPEFVVRRTG